MKLPITLACGLYDRTFGLRDGSVPVEGVELNFLPMMPVETFRRQGRHAEFDASEFSLSTFMVLHSRGDRRFVGIPVYPSRRFRHEHVWINTRANIRSPKDLKGKRVGVQEFVQTAALWIRGFLQHDFGVRTEDVEWFFGGYNEPDPHFKPRIHLELPDKVRARVIPGDQCIDAMLDRGELDAVLPALPASFVRGSPNVARLFPDFRATDLYIAMLDPSRTNIQFPYLVQAGERLRFLREGFARITKDPDYRKAAERLGIDVSYAPGEAFEKQVRAEDQAFKALVKDLNLEAK
jgi:4,5-dihydroxyphthalate decarboxylase